MLLFTDGFDAYGATADLIKKWLTNSTPANITWNATAGRFGAGSLQTVTSGTLTTAILTPNQVAGHVGIAGWFKFSAVPGSIQGFITLPAAIFVVLTTGGQIGMYQGGIGATASPNVCNNTWHWIELIMTTTVSNATQFWSLWVDGTQYVFNTNASIGANNTAGFQQIGFSGLGGVTISIDDLIIVDDQAGLQTGELTTASFPLGPKKCETMWPNGVGTNTHWTPDSGSNYARVNENPPNGDTSYVQSAVSATRDSYAFPGSVTGNTPLVTVVNCYAENADAGAVNIQGLAYSTSYGLGDSKALLSNYVTLQFPIFRDPSTSAAWTKAGVNAAQFGVGVI